MIKHEDLYRLNEYSLHLKSLTDGDKISRFGFKIGDSSIDQLILSMVYNPKDHELWSFTDNGKSVGWGHMAKDKDSWELAVSVEHEHQNKGIGSSLIKDMIDWAKFHKIQEVYMHCIDDNKTIQHLATKHNLKTKERFAGERVASIEVPDATLFEKNAQLFKEQTDIILQIGELRSRLTKLWINPSLK